MDPPSTATGGGAPDDSETTTTATSSNNTPPPPSSPTLTPLRLEAASAPLSLHRDKVSALAWLPPPPAPAGEEEGGGEAAEAEASSLSLGSTSDDGSFRLSGLVWEAGEGAETALVLRSKRHFAPSDVALSCCGLVDGGGRDGGAGNPLAVLSSWDNRVYGALRWIALLGMGGLSFFTYPHMGARFHLFPFPFAFLSFIHTHTRTHTHIHTLNPPPLLPSSRNKPAVYSIRSARRLLELDAHDDGVAALALAPTPTIPATAHGHNPNNSNGSSPCPSPCPSSYLLATGAWDATVKVWSLQAPSGEIDPSPLAEFFDLAAQVQTVAIHVTAAGAGSTLVAAGAEDGRVAVWDVKARGLVASFQATAGGAPVAAVRWGKGAAEAPCLYVAGGDGALACYALDGRRRGAGARLGCELRCLEVVEGGGGGDVLVVGGGDGSVSLWAGASLCVEMAATPLVVVPEAHGGGGGAVTAVAVDWRRRLLATGGQDGGVRVWRVVVG